MKVWYGYGSEHSANLVMIGYFKTAQEAEDTYKLFGNLSEGLRDKVDVGGDMSNRFTDEVLKFLQELKCFSLGAHELEQFLYDTDVSIEDEKIIITTEEADVSAFFKLMMMNGAKVELFSAHDYPEVEYGRGKRV